MNYSSAWMYNCIGKSYFLSLYWISYLPFLFCVFLNIHQQNHYDPIAKSRRRMTWFKFLMSLKEWHWHAHCRFPWRLSLGGSGTFYRGGDISIKAEKSHGSFSSGHWEGWKPTDFYHWNFLYSGGISYLKGESHTQRYHDLNVLTEATNTITAYPK